MTVPYNPNSKYAITVKYANVAHVSWYKLWGSRLHDGLIEIPMNKSYYVYVNKNSIMAISYRTYWSAFVHNFHDGLAKVGNQFINKQAKIVFRTNLNYVYYNFHDGLAAVRVKKQKYGFINKIGKFAIPAEFQKVLWGFHDGLADVKINGKWGFINKEGVLAIPNKFEGISPFDNGISSVELDGNWNYCINKRGKIVIPNKYTSAYWEFLDPIVGISFNEGLAVVQFRKGRKWRWGYIDKKGEFVIPYRFEHACEFHDGLAAVEIGGKWGFINKQGNIVISVKFENADAVGFFHSGFHEGLAMVKLPGSNLKFQINKQGKIVLPMESNVPFKIIY